MKFKHEAGPPSVVDVVCKDSTDKDGQSVPICKDSLDSAAEAQSIESENYTAGLNKGLPAIPLTKEQDDMLRVALLQTLCPSDATHVEPVVLHGAPRIDPSKMGEAVTRAKEVLRAGDAQPGYRLTEANVANLRARAETCIVSGAGTFSPEDVLLLVASHETLQRGAFGREQCAQELYDLARWCRDHGYEARARHTESAARRLQGVPTEDT